MVHHLCWADDLYAMAGAMNHLTRILEDMTNAIERLGMRWKEKNLTIVAGSRSASMEMLLRLSATVVNAGSDEWWRAWRHWAGGWTIEAARRQECGT